MLSYKEADMLVTRYFREGARPNLTTLPINSKEIFRKEKKRLLAVPVSPFD